MALVRTHDLPINNQVQTVGANSPIPVGDPTSYVAFVEEVYHEEGLARVTGGAGGKDSIVPYLPEVGIRKGGLVGVALFSNIPRIVAVIDPGNTATTVFDPIGKLRDDDEDDIFYKIVKAQERYGHEALTGYSTIVAHEDSEKVFACDFSGLKAGIDHAVLFYGENSRIVASERMMSIYSPSIVLLSMVGEHTEIEPEGGEEIGVKKDSVFKIVGESDEGYTEVKEVIIEYKGGVKKGMVDDKITIKQIPGGTLTVTDPVYMMIVIDPDTEKYKIDATEVSHTYINRELNIDGATGDVTINTGVKNSGGMRIDKRDFEYNAIIVDHDGVEKAVTYMKVIGIGGDVFEFSSGKRTEITSEAVKLNTKKSTSIYLGNTTEYFQKNKRTVQFPVVKNTVIQMEHFGSDILSSKGDAIYKFYRHGIFTYLNTYSVHEVDQQSGIKTVEYVSSPVVYKDGTFEAVTLSKNSKLDGVSVRLSHSLSIENVSTSISMEPGRLVTELRSGSKSADMMLSPDLYLVKTSGQLYLGGERFMLDTKGNAVNGLLTLFDGLHVEGDFFISAKSIFMSAKEFIGLDASSVFVKSSKTIYMQYKDAFGVFSDNHELDAERKNKVPAMIWMNKFNSYIQSDGTQVYGRKFLYSFSSGNAAFGGKPAVFFGGSGAR